LITETLQPHLGISESTCRAAFTNSHDVRSLTAALCIALPLITTWKQPLWQISGRTIGRKDFMALETTAMGVLLKWSQSFDSDGYDSTAMSCWNNERI